MMRQQKPLHAAGFLLQGGNCRKQRITAMASHSIAHFQNDIGARVIEIGVREFMCCGASAPFDHPHVFLDMGEENEIVCPYCSTLYRHAAGLKYDETRPAGCLYLAEAI
jgi:uncharacterized Zn-finger protein